MKKTLIIDGGLGRNITSIPSLEKYVEKNPDTTIITNYWTSIFWGNPILTDRVFDINTKGVFERIKDTKIIKPEPYYNTNFISEKISMMQAFNEDLNGSDCIIDRPKLYPTKAELNNATTWIQTNRKNIVFQPFGSTAKLLNDDVIDDSCRSMPKEMVVKILHVLKRNGYRVMIFNTMDAPFINTEDFPSLNHLNYRDIVAIISLSDYFIGCDSAGQHMAYALGKKGFTWWGGSSLINFGYPNWFKIHEKAEHRKYMPFRISEFDYWLAGVQNERTLEYTNDELNDMCEILIEDIKSKT